jgi:hypothetical protein
LSAPDAVDQLADALFDDSDQEMGLAVVSIDDLRALARAAAAVGAREFMAWCVQEKIVTLAGMGGARSRLDEWAAAYKADEETMV